MTKLDDIRAMAKKIRAHVLRMVRHANASHVGSCLSAADILATLYGAVLNVRPQEPDWPGRDRFILSKGHAAAGIYATLATAGFFPEEWLTRYCDDGQPLAGHISHKNVPGVEVSTGALGHGLSIACGMALAGKTSEHNFSAFVLMSDGECDEGSIWEAAMFASQHKLDNLNVIVDHNKLQGFGHNKDIIDLSPFAEKWRAFGWNVIELDGHDTEKLLDALQSSPAVKNKPTAIIAHTIKGKGVSYMEDKLEWHYRSPNDELLAQALSEIGEG